ncbi:MAG: hypothetical protein ACRC4W_02700 [Treponemataceae bacterium]
MSNARKEQLEAKGYKIPVDDDGNGGENRTIKTKAPKEEYTLYTNERTGVVTRVPKGVYPAFASSPAL